MHFSFEIYERNKNRDLSVGSRESLERERAKIETMLEQLTNDLKSFSEQRARQIDSL